MTNNLPCDDVISREAVNKIWHTQYCCNREENEEEQYKRIQQLPSVQPSRKGHWIPFRERLPEDKTYVLTTIKVPNRIAHARSGWYEGGFIHNDNGDTWKATDMEVIAWMPLPKPYKP